MSDYHYNIIVEGTQFLIRKQSLRDCLSEVLFKYLVVPIRRQTGWSAQKVSLLPLFIYFMILLGFAAAAQSILWDIASAVTTTALWVLGRAQTRRLALLSHGIPSMQVMHFALAVCRTRCSFLLGFYAGLGTVFCIFQQWEGASLVIIYGIIFYAHDAMVTCGGTQTKRAKDPKRVKLRHLIRSLAPVGTP